jgi:NADPH:quinone reductase-like Zn-dependent oxidoreductase
MPAHITFNIRFNDMNKLISANVDATRPIVDKVFAYEDAKAAYAYLESQAHVGKVVIKVWWCVVTVGRIMTAC